MPGTRDEQVADFTLAFVRRALRGRLAGHGRIELRRLKRNGFLIVHHYVSAWTGHDVAFPVAQLRRNGQRLVLYWKRANGRWVPYEAEDTPFAGGLNACVNEIKHDRWGCFWG